ncbi:MAG: hypothetical protein N3A63_02300 [Bacteroidetes bacterium]|nr:hypothetical protein [Bacteroidota bacterium]
MKNNFSFKVIRVGLRFLLLVQCPHTILAQEKHYYFYKPVPYGSEALYNPVTLILNGGFDPFQMLNDREPSWKNVYWKSATTNVWRCITAPGPIINKYGWSKFVGVEIFPTSFRIEEGQYAPNYALHLLGGGMEYRKMSEWYDYHNVPVPYFFGALTRIAYEYLNEVVENGMNYYPNVDCIPDFLIFQPLGILLFSFDGVAEYFSHQLSFNSWPHQVALSFAPFAVRNASQTFIAKIPLNSTRTKSLFLNFGCFVQLGYSYKLDSEHSLTIAAGATSKGRRPLPVRNDVPSNTIIIGPMAGIYYDRNNSLLASFVFADTYFMRYRLNIYPGIISLGSLSPGFFLSIDTNKNAVVGITLPVLPVGIGAKL